MVTADRLPERVASHFGPMGHADGWMSRTAYLGTFVGFVCGLSIFLPTVFYCVRFLPASGINLPNRDYWLAPERRAETYRILFQVGIWLACFQVLLMLGLHLLVVEANASQPPRMSDAVFVLGGSFLLAIGILIYFLVRRFGSAVSVQ